MTLAAALAASAAGSKLEIDIWGGPAPGSEAVAKMQGLPFEYVTPRLTVFLPDQEKRNGTFVLVVPGGGYMYCSARGGEGFKAAEWLRDRGIGAAVVQYRRNIFQDRDKTMNRVYDANVALEDSERSMRIVHAHAKEWGIDSDRIGIMGFSAGGHIAATMAVHPKPGNPNAGDVLERQPTRPAFMVLAYSLISMAPPLGGAIWRDNLLGKGFDPKRADYYSCQKHVTKNTPPAFIVTAADDFTVEDSLVMVKAMRAKRVPCEYHLFEHGGHGYGMTKPDNPVTESWPLLLQNWLTHRGLIPKDTP
jgi:acetyl esterase/lipase